MTTHGHGISERPTQPRPSIATQIKELILRSRLQTGDLLPPETDLCQELGASRSSVREAIKTLTALDIVEVRRGHGTYVGGVSLNALIESLAFRGLLGSQDDHELFAELVEVRQMLEQGLAKAIVSAMNPQVCAELGELAEEMRRRAERGETFLDLDRALHLAMMQPLKNRLLLQLTGAFWDVHTILTPSLLPHCEEDITRTINAHLAIVEAAARSDVPALVRALEAHYGPVRERIIALASLRQTTTEHPRVVATHTSASARLGRKPGGVNRQPLAHPTISLDIGKRPTHPAGRHFVHAQP